MCPAAATTAGSAVTTAATPEQGAQALQNAGYATDPMYADKLSRIINGTTLRQALTEG